MDLFGLDVLNGLRTWGLDFFLSEHSERSDHVRKWEYFDRYLNEGRRDKPR